MIDWVLRKRSACLLFLCAVLSAFAPAGATESLRVVTDDNYPPYVFRDHEGQQVGYIVDWWALWSRKTGIDVTLTATSWAKAQQTLLAGEADVIDMIYRTPEREVNYDFSRPYAELPVVIYSHVSIAGINAPETLRGFQVGVQAGDACIDKLDEHGISTRVEYPNYRALIEAAQRQEIKVFCLDESPANFYLYKLGAQGDFQQAFVLYKGEFHRAVRKGQTDLLARVEQGAAAISADEEAALRKKWFGTPLDFSPYARYLLWALLVLGVAGAVLLLWNLMLRRQVALRTEALVQAREAALLAERDKFFRDLFDAAPVALAYLRGDTVVSVNRRFVELFGVDERELPTTEAWWPRAYPDPEYRAWVRQSWGEALSRAQAGDGQVEAGEFRVHTGLSGERFMLIGGQWIGEGLIVTLTDVTVLKAAETALLESKLAAEEANAAKSRFLANMSHEIRTPMNAIIGYAHLLRRSTLTSGQRDQLDRIADAGVHLLAVINDILDISKIEAGRMLLEQTDFSVAALFDDVQSLIGDAVAAKGLAVIVDHGELPEHLVGDQTRLRQCLLNYANNALKFTERGFIQLRGRIVEKPDDHQVLVRFEVEDSGIGIPQDKQATLFQSFQQVDASTTRKYGGSGLGLAITQRLARLMGGDAGVDSQAGSGSTFWFTARLGIGQTPAALQVGVQEDAEGRIRALHAGKTVLLVEDDPINQQVAMILLNECGLQVDLAENGRLAVDMAAQKNYALILMDMQMPEMDGLEATRVIRSSPSGGSVPIIAMTANAFDDDRADCLTAGMNDFLPKPVDPALLFGMLVRWLEQPGE